MPGPWNPSSERKLLLCIIGLHSRLKWDVIAQRMGEQFTEEACRQKYYKLKRESDKLVGNTSAATPLVKAEGSLGAALTKPGRGRKRKSEEEERSGALKRVRKAPAATSAHHADQGPPGPVKLEDGAIHWESDDELPIQDNDSQSVTRATRT